MKNRKTNRCIDCNKKIYPNSKRCIICHNKNREITDEHKKNTSLSAINNKNYGFRGKKHSKKTIEKIKLFRAKQKIPFKDSKIELKIQRLLKNLKINFEKHHFLDIKHSYLCDILIPSMNLVIECDGDYWHNYPIGSDIDHIRNKEIIKKGYKLLRLWERDIKLLEEEDLKLIVHKILTANSKKASIKNLD
jgi:very-short-patch-repair endonuclease